MSMAVASQPIFLTGLASAAALIALLAVSSFPTILSVWPRGDHWSWQTLTFWSLFRLTNLAALVTIAGDWMPGLIHSPPRLAAATAGALCFVAYAVACFQLGRENLYGGTDGLRTRGIYRWSRNPQYALAAPGYITLALGSQSGRALCLAALLAFVFWQMAVLEERWLLATYGSAYSRYCRRVARFYNFDRLRALVRRSHSSTRQLMQLEK
jgi:protein-S-isoprenylcysteine O-methyltransferase Ste14